MIIVYIYEFKEELSKTPSGLIKINKSYIIIHKDFMLQLRLSNFHVSQDKHQSKH